MARIILNKNNIPVGLVFNNNLIISNGADGPMETNNTTLNKLQSVNWKSVNLLELHKNRVFGGNWSASPSGLIWTYANDETTVDATSIATVFAQDNGQMVAMKSFANSLMVFKDNGKVYQITGEFDQSAAGQPAMIRAIDVPDNLGVISGKSVCVLEDNSGAQGYQRLGSKVYFLSETGIYTINSWMQVQKVSWDIQPTLANILLKSTATTTKQYSFTSKAQWDAGTINSLSDTRVLNGMSSFFDTLNLSGATQNNGAAAMFIDSVNDVHTAYGYSAGLRYNHWLASDNTNVDSVVLSTSDTTIKDLSGNPVFPNLLDPASPGSISTAFYMTGPWAVSIATAPNGNIGISHSWATEYPSPAPANEGTVYTMFSEFASGAWITTLIHKTPGFIPIAPRPLGAKLRYDSGNNINLIVLTGDGIISVPGGTAYDGSYAIYMARTSGTWSSVVDFGSGHYAGVDFTIDSGGNIHVILADQGSTVLYYKSTNNGVSWTNPKNITVAGTSPSLGVGSVGISVDAALDPILIYNFTGGIGGDVGKTVRYNVTTSTSSYVDSSANALKGYSNSSSAAEFFYEVAGGLEKFIFDTNYTSGTAAFTNGLKVVTGTNTKWTTWIASGDKIRLGSDSETDFATVDTVNSDNSITLLANYAGTTNGSAAAYVAKRANSVTAPSGPVMSTAYTIGNGMSQNGNTVATISFGLSAGEIRIRRVTLFGQWTSAVVSDSSMVAWSTYVVTNPISNGNSILYEAGVNTTGTIDDSLMNIIVPGSVISTAAASIDVKARITFTLKAFAIASVDTLVLNYIGLGIDSKMPFGYVFNNEMYLSVTAPSGAGNNEIIFLDRAGAWGTFSQGSCAMTRYNNQLYVGDTLGGNIFKFRQGYDFNGSAYSMIATTKEDLLGSMEMQKEIYKVYVIYETQSSGTFKFSYRFDNFLTAAGATWNDVTVDQTVGSVYEVSGISGRPLSSIQFKIQQDDADVQVGIIGFMVLYKYLNVR
jgi:hypothetical protein